MRIIDFQTPPELVRKEIVGNKFYNLYLLNQIPHITVPQAFCISERNFNEKEIRQKLKNNQRYAIRSSASLEDSAQYSAAGVFKSYLNLDDYDEILEAIISCFESATASEALNYFQSRNIEIGKLHMSVIVQEMIEAELTGVLFTLNPVNGNEEYLIEYVDAVPQRDPSPIDTPKYDVIHKDDRFENPLYTLLYEVGKKLEKYFNKPQDIEWVWANGHLYVLQSRPLVLKHGKAYLPTEVWTRANIGEIIPRPLTPLSWSIFQEIISHSYRFRFYSLPDWVITNFVHLIPRTPPLFKTPQNFFGVMYLNLDTIDRSLGNEPWVNRVVLEVGLGLKLPSNIKKTKRTIYDFTALFLKKMLYVIELIFPFLSMENRIEQFIRRSTLYKDNLESMDFIDLIHLNQFLMGWHIALTGRSYSHLGFMLRISKIFRKYRINLNKIVSWLSREQIDPYFREFKGLFRIAEDLNPVDLEKKKEEFLERFLDKFGHRSENEFELSQSSWIENPAILQKLMIMSFPSREPADLSFKLPYIFRKLFNRMALSIQKREELKSLLIKNYRRFRYIFLDQGQQLLKKNLIQDVKDLFFLTFQEINNISKYDKKKLSRLIKKRKSEFQNNFRQRIPIILMGEISREQLLPLQLNGRVLKGIGCSEGNFTGQAVVLKNYNDSIQISKNNIIVTVSADPGWIPLLLNAGGMITEMGGILSHICTIARESGIPIVVGIKNVTDVIKTGQMISIDGNNGMIILTDKFVK